MFSERAVDSSFYLIICEFFVELDGYTCGTAVEIACAASPKPAETTMVAAPLPSAEREYLPPGRISSPASAASRCFHASNHGSRPNRYVFA